MKNPKNDAKVKNMDPDMAYEIVLDENKEVVDIIKIKPDKLDERKA